MKTAILKILKKSVGTVSWLEYLWYKKFLEFEIIKSDKKRNLRCVEISEVENN